MFKFPSIEALHRRPEILSVKEVVATEKLHGTNFRVFFPAGILKIEEIQYGARNEEFGTGENGSFYGGRPVAWFKERPGLLETMLLNLSCDYYPGQDVTVFGEMCGTSIQKDVHYAAPGEVIFRAFAIQVGENFLSFDRFASLCDQIELPRVKEVWRGPPSLAAFDALLNVVSPEGQANGVSSENNFAEGVVIQSNPLLRTVFGEYLMIKHKTEKFKEQKKVVKPGGANMDVSDALAAEFVTQGRVLNVLGKLRDVDAELTDDMGDMRILAPAVSIDIFKECQPEWTAAVALGATDNSLQKSIRKVLADVYRQMLNERVAT